MHQLDWAVFQVRVSVCYLPVSLAFAYVVVVVDYGKFRRWMCLPLVPVMA